MADEWDDTENSVVQSEQPSHRGRGRNFRNNDDSQEYNNGGGWGDNNENEGRSSRGRGARGGGGKFTDRNNEDNGNGDFGDNDQPPVSDKPRPTYIPPEIDENELNGVEAGINFKNYVDFEVIVNGDTVPTHIESFKNSGLREVLLEKLDKCTVPTPIQKYSIPIILNGRDLMASAQTGSGKTMSNTFESKSYVNGENVLVQLNDGKFYLGFIAKLMFKENKCLVKFDDDKVIWTFLRYVTRLYHKIKNIQFCYVCNKEVQIDDVCVCDKCAEAYHRKCHKPEVTVSDISVWVCFLCSGKQKNNLLQVMNSRSTTDSKLVKLPYDLNSLQWDVQHSVNTSGIYCYCGGPGDWFIGMLQCKICLQWFHQKCITPLAYPVYNGDRFYVFLCSVCNSGAEFVCRIEMKWFDLVHLALFNLTAYKPEEFYDVDINILPYLDKHWNSLCLPPKIFDVPVNDRKRYVIKSLHEDPKCRFQCQGNKFGLQLKLPPNPPFFKLPRQLPKEKNILLYLLDLKLNINILPSPKQTDPTINQKLTDSMYSVEGLQYLHQHLQVAMLPKRCSSNGNNLCIKSASRILPAFKFPIKRQIKKGQEQTNDGAPTTAEPEKSEFHRSQRLSVIDASTSAINQPQIGTTAPKSYVKDLFDDYNYLVKRQMWVKNIDLFLNSSLAYTIICKRTNVDGSEEFCIRLD